MTVFHDEVEIEDFEYDEETETYYFPCPCGDRFAITKASCSNSHYLTNFQIHLFSHLYKYVCTFIYDLYKEELYLSL